MSTPSNRRLLLVTYQFPPVGGAGVQRVAQFARHLPDFGWDVTVLTAANPSAPTRDASLDRPLPAGSRVVRARTFEPGYALKARAIAAADARKRRGWSPRGWVRGVARALLQPDPQVLWRPAAARAGRAALRAGPHHAILASAPPYSVLLLARSLARSSGLPLVADFRDEWELANRHWEQKAAGGWSSAWQGRMERSVLRDAALILATSPGSARRLADRARRAGGRAEAASLPNGFDRDDFPEGSTIVDEETCRIVYTGTLWNLTSAAPVVSAALKLAEHRPELARRLGLTWIGRKTPEQERLLDRLAAEGYPGPVDRRPYTEHAEAASAVRSAGAVLVLLALGEGAERVIPAKVFEAMAARRPILAVMPRGDAWDVLEGHPAAWRVEPGDEAGLAAALAELASGVPEGRLRALAGFPIDRWERRAQAAELAEHLDRLLAAPVGATSKGRP